MGFYGNNTAGWNQGMIYYIPKDEKGQFYIPIYTNDSPPNEFGINYLLDMIRTLELALIEQSLTEKEIKQICNVNSVIK